MSSICLTLALLRVGLPSVTAQVAPLPVTVANPAIVAIAKPTDSPFEAARPPGMAMYVARHGDTVATVAHRYVSQTSYLTSTELMEAIRRANGDLRGNSLKLGQSVLVPGMLDHPISEKSIPVAKDFETRAIYLTGLMAGSDHGLRIIRRWRELGGNAVVFDVKDSDGSINIPFDSPLAGPHHVTIRDLPKFTQFL